MLAWSVLASLIPDSPLHSNEVINVCASARNLNHTSSHFDLWPAIHLQTILSTELHSLKKWWLGQTPLPLLLVFNIYMKERRKTHTSFHSIPGYQIALKRKQSQLRPEFVRPFCCCCLLCKLWGHTSGHSGMLLVSFQFNLLKTQRI